MKSLKFTALTCLFSAFSAVTQAAAHFPLEEDFLKAECEPYRGGTDYRRNDPETNHLKRLVEGAHFTASVRRGISGNTTALIEGDLEYVLRKFPNHAHALLLMANRQLEEDFKFSKPGRIDYLYPKKECFFQRALRMAPDDGNVHLVIAIFYHKHENIEVAQRHYRDATRFASDNPETFYNYGLFLLDNNQPEEAMKQAKVAYDMGYPLPGLKNRLIAANAWNKDVTQ